MAPGMEVPPHWRVPAARHCRGKVREGGCPHVRTPGHPQLRPLQLGVCAGSQPQEPLGLFLAAFPAVVRRVPAAQRCAASTGSRWGSVCFPRRPGPGGAALSTPRLPGRRVGRGFRSSRRPRERSPGLARWPWGPFPRLGWGSQVGPLPPPAPQPRAAPTDGSSLFCVQARTRRRKTTLTA